MSKPAAAGGRTLKALFLASGQATTISGHLEAAAALCNQAWGVDVVVATPTPAAEIAAATRSKVDLLVFDGHGYRPARVGRLALDPQLIRDEHGHGITAPIVVLGACGGATGPFKDALRACLDTPDTVFVGCTGRAPFTDAELVFPGVVGLLADLGTPPPPAEFLARLAALLQRPGGPAGDWEACLLSPTGPIQRPH